MGLYRGAAASNRAENFKVAVWSLRFRVVDLVCVPASEPPQRNIDSVFRRYSRFLRHCGRTKLEDERRRNEEDVVVLGALLFAASIHTVWFFEMLTCLCLLAHHAPLTLTIKHSETVWLDLVQKHRHVAALQEELLQAGEMLVEYMDISATQLCGCPITVLRLRDVFKRHLGIVGSS